MKLRGAKATEAGALSELALRSKAHWGYPPEFLEACRDELSYSGDDLREHTFVVAEEGDAIIGFYGLVCLDPERVELEALFVEPACIGRGYGRALIEHAKATAERMGARTMVIQGDPHAAEFYRVAGAEQIGSRESASIPARMLPLFEVTIGVELGLAASSRGKRE